jgi:hypothetical protein
MQGIITVFAIALLFYIARLQSQLHLSRRVIDTLQRTAVTIRQQPEAAEGVNRRALIALIGIVVTLMMLLNSLRP